MRNIMNIKIAGSLLVLSGLICGCRTYRQEISEWRLTEFRCEERIEAGRRILHLTASPVSSLYLLHKPEVEIVAKTLHVHVFLGGRDVKLDLTVTIPDEVESVTIGKDRREIWQRAVGCVGSDRLDK